MVAYHDMDRAAGSHCLALESHQQIHGITRPGSSIEDVANDHQVRSRAGPRKLLIDNPGLLQSIDHGLKRTMHIGDRNDSLDAINVPVVSLHRTAGDEYESEDYFCYL
jgi:hypothetical protein